MPGQQYAKVALNGTLGPVNTPWEIFSMGISLGGLGDWGPLADERRLIVNAITEWFGRAGTQISNQARLRECAFSIVGPDGKQLGETLRMAVNQAGASAAQIYPSQVALRISLGSGNRGRSQRGGFFLPLPTVGLNGNEGLVPVADIAAVMDSTATFLAALNAVPNAEVIVASSVAGNVGVSVMRIGRRLDTIRRRGNALPELYTSRTIGAAGGNG